MKLHVFGFGTLQIVITTVLLSYLIQSYFEIELSVSILITAALSMSSTAIVLQVLSEHRRQSTQVGRLALAVLLMQDLAVVPLLTILPILAQGSDDLLLSVGKAGIKAIMTIIIITISGRLLLRPFFSIIGSAKSDEIYVTTSLLIVLGASSITSELGLSNAMGAFLAGLLIAETEYRNKIEDSIMPFQGLFLALFFLSVGMSIDINFIIEHFKTIFLYAFVLVFVKILVILLLCRLFRFRWGSAINSSFLLCQGGEFAFILFSMAARQNIIPQEFAQMLLMVVTVSMAVTPLLAILGNKIEDSIDNKDEVGSNMEFKGVSDLHNHVIIAGFGRVGRMVAYMLSQEQIDYIAVDSNVSLVKKARAQGFPIYHGDLSSDDILRAVGISRATAVVITMVDKISVRKATKRICKEFKKELKHLSIITRVEDYKHAEITRKLGAHIAVPATIETGLQLGTAVLLNHGIPEDTILNMKAKIRKNDYLLSRNIELNS
jgi:CPA2 family monovalent cation:H+ antiporter-2